MPRHYTRKLGCRRYKDYDSDTVDRAILEIKQKKLTYRQAVDKYGIPLGTLSRKIQKKNIKKLLAVKLYSPQWKKIYLLMP